MTALSTKKAQIYRFERNPLPGYLDANALGAGGELQLLTPEGVVQPVALEQVKAICLVREWLEGAAWTRNQYAVRPRQPGLWVRLRFRDGEELEATMPNSLALLEPAAITVTPPEVAAGVQRVMVPRSALSGFEVLGVVGSPLKKKRAAASNQLSMFE